MELNLSEYEYKLLRDSVSLRFTKPNKQPTVFAQSAYYCILNTNSKEVARSVYIYLATALSTYWHGFARTYITWYL
jgi:hypothetical protein